MPKSEYDVFFDMVQQLFKYIEKIRNKKLNVITKEDSSNSFPEEKKYNQFQGKNTAKSVENYYELKKEVSSQRNNVSNEKRNMKSEETSFSIDFTEESILQAVVYSEILGKPKAKTRRW